MKKKKSFVGWIHEKVFRQKTWEWDYSNERRQWMFCITKHLEDSNFKEEQIKIRITIEEL